MKLTIIKNVPRRSQSTQHHQPGLTSRAALSQSSLKPSWCVSCFVMCFAATAPGSSGAEEMLAAGGVQSISRLVSRSDRRLGGSDVSDSTAGQGPLSLLHGRCSHGPGAEPLSRLGPVCVFGPESRTVVRRSVPLVQRRCHGSGRSHASAPSPRALLTQSSGERRFGSGGTGESPGPKYCRNEPIAL